MLDSEMVQKPRKKRESFCVNQGEEQILLEEIRFDIDSLLSSNFNSSNLLEPITSLIPTPIPSQDLSTLLDSYCKLANNNNNINNNNNNDNKNNENNNNENNNNNMAELNEKINLLMKQNEILLKTSAELQRKLDESQAEKQKFAQLIQRLQILYEKEQSDRRYFLAELQNLKDRSSKEVDPKLLALRFPFYSFLLFIISKILIIINNINNGDD